ncbi:unnamed protein product, partial [Musa textilis]
HTHEEPGPRTVGGVSRAYGRGPPWDARGQGAPHPAYHHPVPPWLIHSRWALMSPHQIGPLGCAAPMLIRLKNSPFLTNVGLNAPCLPALGAHPLLGCTAAYPLLGRTPSWG